MIKTIISLLSPVKNEWPFFFLVLSSMGKDEWVWAQLCLCLRTLSLAHQESSLFQSLCTHSPTPPGSVPALGLLNVFTSFWTLMSSQTLQGPCHMVLSLSHIKFAILCPLNSCKIPNSWISALGWTSASSSVLCILGCTAWPCFNELVWSADTH